jgi:hypothetical protein
VTRPPAPDRFDGDISLPTIWRTALAVLAVTIASAIVCAAVLRTFGQEHDAGLREAGRPAFPAKRGRFPEPSIQVYPWQQRRDLRASEDEALGEYRWEDREAGLVRIPVVRAIEVMAAETDPMRALVAPPPVNVPVPEGEADGGPQPDGAVEGAP